LTDLITPSFSIEETGYCFLGRGPDATGPSLGWNNDNSIYYRCVKCGSFMLSTINEGFNCECGCMNLDIDAGRFGSRLGDDNILVYRKDFNLTKPAKIASKLAGLFSLAFAGKRYNFKVVPHIMEMVQG
jgi:hypothetical protein